MTTIENLARKLAAGFPSGDAETLRTARKLVSKQITLLKGEEVIQLAKLLIRKHELPNFVGYELIQHHPEAARKLNAKELDDLVSDLHQWHTVDPFASYLSGVAWRNGQVSDKFIHKWARSENLWIRRAALVSTVPLNNKARGGSGDAERTLAVCDLLVNDREDMVVKALSWALRELAKRDPIAVRRYVGDNEGNLAARVLREVNTKLNTGLKNKRR